MTGVDAISKLHVQYICISITIYLSKRKHTLKLFTATNPGTRMIHMLNVITRIVSYKTHSVVGLISYLLMHWR